MSSFPEGEIARQSSFTWEQINLIERLAAEWLAGNNLTDDLEANSIYDFIDFVKQFEEDVMPRPPHMCWRPLCRNRATDSDFCSERCRLAGRT